MDLKRSRVRIPAGTLLARSMYIIIHKWLLKFSLNRLLLEFSDLSGLIILTDPIKSHTPSPSLFLVAY